MDVWVSEHGEQRCRERMGIPRRAVQRAAEKAWQSGVVSRCAAVEADKVVKIWGNQRFVFGHAPGGPTLVTVLPLKEYEELKLTSINNKIWAEKHYARKRIMKKRDR